MTKRRKFKEKINKEKKKGINKKIDIETQREKEIDIEVEIYNEYN